MGETCAAKEILNSVNNEVSNLNERIDPRNLTTTLLDPEAACLTLEPYVPPSLPL